MIHENCILFLQLRYKKLIFLSGYYHILRNYSFSHCTGALFLCRSEIRLIAKGKPSFCTRMFTAAANLAADLILCVRLFTQGTTKGHTHSTTRHAHGTFILLLGSHDSTPN